MQLAYFASPMCSWCWGFSPVIEQVQKTFAQEIDFRLVLVPFRIDTVEPMNEKLRNYVLEQWHKVHETTAQSFEFTFKMPKYFVYNTMPACLAIKAFTIQQPKNELKYLNTIHEAFYTKNIDVTNEKILINLAKNYEIEIDSFVEDINSTNIRTLLQKDFNYCQQLGANAYPTLIGIHNGKNTLLSHGFSPFEDLQIKIKNWKNAV